MTVRKGLKSSGGHMKCWPKLYPSTNRGEIWSQSVSLAAHTSFGTLLTGVEESIEYTK